MRHLKSFNEGLNSTRIRHLFNTIRGKKIKPEDGDRILSDIKDICLELKDEGFNVDIIPHLSPQELKEWFGEVKILIYRSHMNTRYANLKKFNYSEISETIERLIDYLKEFKISEMKISQICGHDDKIITIPIKSTNQIPQNEIIIQFQISFEE